MIQNHPLLAIARSTPDGMKSALSGLLGTTVTNSLDCHRTWTSQSGNESGPEIWGGKYGFSDSFL